MADDPTVHLNIPRITSRDFQVVLEGMDAYIPLTNTRCGRALLLTEYPMLHWAYNHAVMKTKLHPERIGPFGIPSNQEVSFLTSN